MSGGSGKPPLRTIIRRPLTRRDLMKAAPIGAVAAGALGLGLWGTGAQAAVRTKGTCRFCLMHCGVISEVRGGRLHKVEGDLKSRTRGFVCEHGYALREMVHSHSRVRAPLIRHGDAFQEVGWDDALGEVAKRLEAVKRRFGPETFLIQCGWPLVRHPLVGFLHRFARAYGSPNVATVASLCEASLRMGQSLVAGTKYQADLKNLRTLAVWGANPPTSAPPFAHVVAAKALKGALIVVDPLKTTLAKEATLHLAVRPGTDGALALGMIQVVISERLYDSNFIEAASVGFPELSALAAQYPLERVRELTGVPSERVAKAARLLATPKPSGIWAGLGVEHHENGVQAIRAIASLEVLCGRWDGSHESRSVVSPLPPGFPETILPALYDMATPEPVPPPVTARALGRDQYPLYEVFNREAQGQLLADAILEGKPAPIRAVMLMASNALVTSQGAERLQRAAENLDLLVTVDPFLTLSAQRSDVVLPAATFAEAPDVDDDDAVAKGSMVPPQHQAWPDWKIVVELARRMGLESYFPWDSFHDAMRAPRVPWMVDPASQPRPKLETDAPKFGTTSGKAEFASRLLPHFGYDALPIYTPPTEPISEAFPLWLTTGGRPRAYINSQFHGVPSVEARMRQNEALIHPSAAKRAGVEHGRPVAVVSPYGRIVLRAVVTEDIQPECVSLAAGWTEANANLLISPDKRDPISGFPAFRSGVCRVEPA